MTRHAALEALAEAVQAYGMTAENMKVWARTAGLRGEASGEAWCRGVASALYALARAESDGPVVM